MKHVMIFQAVIFVSLMIFSGCAHDPLDPEHDTAYLRDFNGLDGCGWVLELNNGNYLEPQNLSDFSVDLVDGNEVRIEYQLTNNASVCMTGVVVELTDVRD